MHVFQRLGRMAPRKPMRFTFGILLCASTIVASILTYRAFTILHFADASSKKMVWLLNIDLALLLIFLVLILKRIIKIWSAHKTGNPAAKLHTRFTVLFAVVAITPTILMTIFSSMHFSMGLHQWFSERIKVALSESTKVAQAYLEEHQKNVAADANHMAYAISLGFFELRQNPQQFREFLNHNTQGRNLDEALVFDGSADVLAKSRFSFSLALESFSYDELKRAELTAYLKESEDGQRVRALRKIPKVDAYVVVGRMVDPQIIKRVRDVETARSEYMTLEAAQGKVQLQFTLIFIAIALMLLFSAVWVGVLFANRITTPIAALMTAAQEVRDGNYAARLKVMEDTDEIASLMIAFNTMTERIQEQKSRLLAANREKEERRAFLETVLKGVSHGVIGADDDNRVLVINRAGCTLLHIDEAAALGQRVQELVPEFLGLIEEYHSDRHKTLAREIRLPVRKEMHHVSVRISPKDLSDVYDGYIITFADVTDLVTAQRKAAWADVARRIAHEIRNPLTPIQLSAERLSRKFAKQISEDREKFEQCLFTIMHHVDHIGTMVQEFSNFARLPEPKLVPVAVQDIVRSHINPFERNHPDIRLGIDYQSQALRSENVMCDLGQIGQVFSNLFRNAREALEGKTDTQAAIDIQISYGQEEVETVCFAVQDSGPGFPEQERSKLVEPYETRKPQGTGLGLAIVKKIVEDHGGTLVLGDSRLGGASVTFTLRIAKEAHGILNS